MILPTTRDALFLEQLSNGRLNKFRFNQTGHLLVRGLMAKLMLPLGLRPVFSWDPLLLLWYVGRVQHRRKGPFRKGAKRGARVCQKVRKSSLAVGSGMAR